MAYIVGTAETKTQPSNWFVRVQAGGECFRIYRALRERDLTPNCTSPFDGRPGRPSSPGHSPVEDLLVDKHVADIIQVWIDHDGYAGLSLGEYLDKMSTAW